MSITSKIINNLILIREFLYKYIFGKIIVIKNYKKFYYFKKPFFLPYIFYIFLNFYNYEYVYTYDTIHFYNDNKNKIELLPPILVFKINNKCYLDKIKNYKSNIPFRVFLELEKITNLNCITYKVLKNPLNICDKNLNLSDINLDLTLKDLLI